MSLELALGSAFVAGVASSVGPCIAPRYLMLAAQLAVDEERARVPAFIAGCLGGYLAYASAGALLAIFRMGTHVIYALLGVGLIASGVRTLLAAHHAACASKARRPLSLGAASLAGLTSSLMFSPCCTPIAMMFGFLASQSAGASGAGLLLAFGLGHTLPIALIAFAPSFPCIRNVPVSRDVRATIGGSLLVSVGGLYAILA